VSGLESMDALAGQKIGADIMVAEVAAEVAGVNANRATRRTTQTRRCRNCLE
jgi:hypothetical protein